MTPELDPPAQTLGFYATAAYPCSYLSGRIARSQVATPSELINHANYSALVDMGFRRSGGFVYRPHCDHCDACQSIRLPVASFKPSRSQKRAWVKHVGLETRVCEPHFSEAHHALYLRYQHARHAGGGMDQDDPSQYIDFLVTTRVNSVMVEFHETSGAMGADTLRMVSIIDVLQNGLSAVYTFYEPDPHQDYGTFNVLWQVAYARALGLTHVYLGYWISESSKMAYKARFSPSQIYKDKEWTLLSTS